MVDFSKSHNSKDHTLRRLSVHENAVECIVYTKFIDVEQLEVSRKLQNSKIRMQRKLLKAPTSFMKKKISK